MEYLIPVVLTIIGIILNSRLKQPAPKIVLMCVILIYIILLMGFRYRVGMDTIGYITRFKKVALLDNLTYADFFEGEHEPGYVLLSSIVKTLTGEFWPVQLISNAIMSICIFIFLYRKCTNVFVGIFFFLVLQWLYFSTEIIRQSIAIGIFLVNYRNAEKKRWFWYYFFSLFSIAFHYSAILTWVLPFVRFLKPNLTYIILCIAMIGITPLLETLNKLLFLGVMTEKVSVYIKDVDTVNMNWRIAEFIKSGLPAVLALVMYHISKKDMKNRQFVLLQVLFCCGAFAVPVIFQRFTNYTTLFIAVALANYVSDSRVKSLARMFVVGFVCLSQSLYYTSMYPTWFPYESIFDPVKNERRERFYREIW